MDPGQPHRPTAALCRTGRATGIAVLLCWLLALAGRLEPFPNGWLLGGSPAPWSGEADATRLGLAVALSVLVGPLTWLRASVHGGPVPAPPNAAREILAGCAASLACVAAAVLAGAVAVLGRITGPDPGLAWDPALALDLAVLAGTAAAAFHAGRLCTQARALWPPASAAADAPRPDVLDDTATFVARLLPGSSTARAVAWLVRGLDTWSWSPRRHRTGFVTGCAALAGLAWPAWQGLAGSTWPKPSDAAVAAVLAAVGVAVVLVGEIAWLGLLRNAPAPAR